MWKFREEQMQLDERSVLNFGLLILSSSEIWIPANRGLIHIQNPWDCLICEKVKPCAHILPVPKTQDRNSNLCFQFRPISLLMGQAGRPVDETSEQAFLSML